MRSRTIASSGSLTRSFGKIRDYALMRLAGVIAKRHQRSRAFGWSVVAYKSGDQLGLMRLDGIVVAPRPHQAWRG
ncbi:hypothetical protein ER308_01425 [Egibacter rhizosphaerae]|uniref:Uncharacterized protein n=2 Tax=Egibacter rhizosphaerae TaxID=1670831 RepID=A0A411YAX7_9ACTN|nr:hypothetical protein ER308_01425 [Egibacter rhizosphaerae]